ncbi:hypothetical protein ACHAWU_003219 [Discostella pseudostelligera]|uniref:PDZ domain-containing protein n=1 Tax=Discostella pseudostelligera TaxID=259834 RepID=A0ABD3NDS3_9STRA
MAEEIRNKFVSWTLNVVKEIKEIPAKKSPTSPTASDAAAAAAATSAEATDAPAVTTTNSRTNTNNSSKKEKGNEIYGVGVNLAFVPQPSSTSSSSPRVGVHSLEPTGPAAKAGLQPGDIILSANNTTFHENKYYLPDDVAAAIRGPEGSYVKVLVERNGKKLEFDLKREPIGMMIPSLMSPTATTTTITASVSSAPCAIEEGEKKPKEDESGDKNSGSTTAATTTTSNKNKKNLFDTLHHTLSLSEEEHKDEKELASSLEDADQFDDDIVVANPSSATATKRLSSSSLNMEASSCADAASSEEKTIDNNDINDNNSTSIGDDHSASTTTQWEMLSERSGSAILISFSGSISNASYSFHRSPSPSVLKNKFVLTESNGEAYIHHVVLPTDTLQGLCLAYKLSATRLRMENNFSGNSLQLAPKKLRIPNNVASRGGVNSSNHNNNKGMMIRVQDTTSKEYKLYAFVAEIPTMELVEAKAYLDLSNWDLEEALRSAREDEGWSLRNNDGDGFDAPTSFSSGVGDTGAGAGATTAGEMLASPMINAASAKPKALTAHDIYSGMPPYDGDGFELSDIKQR